MLTDYAPILILLGLVLGFAAFDEERIAAGREIVDGILSDEPSNPQGLFVRAKIEMAELDPKAAAATLRSALDVRPDWAKARFVLGSALMLLGDQNGARAEMARAVESEPSLLGMGPHILLVGKKVQ